MKDLLFPQSVYAQRAYRKILKLPFFWRVFKFFTICLLLVQLFLTIIWYSNEDWKIQNINWPTIPLFYRPFVWLAGIFFHGNYMLLTIVIIWVYLITILIVFIRSEIFSRLLMIYVIVQSLVAIFDMLSIGIVNMNKQLATSLGLNETYPLKMRFLSEISVGWPLCIIIFSEIIFRAYYSMKRKNAG